MMPGEEATEELKKERLAVVPCRSAAPKRCTS